MAYLHINLFTIVSPVIQFAIALRCYSCSFSFNELYDMEHRDAWCANESLVLYDVEETSKTCAPWEAFCVTAVMTINNAFTSVSRGCGERCSELCESEGYGQDQVNCDDCCEDDLCNANFSVQYYITMMESQYTSWTKPLSGEQDWNNKSGLRFPVDLLGLFGRHHTQGVDYTKVAIPIALIALRTLLQ